MFFIFPVLDKCLYKTFELGNFKRVCTKPLYYKTFPNRYHQINIFFYFLFLFYFCFFFLFFLFFLLPSLLNSNFLLLANFTFMWPFQCPVYLSCIISQSKSIPLVYHLFIILTLKILPNSIFSIFLFCPLWRPIIILHLVSSLGFITLSIGYNSQSLPFWESERLLTLNLEISTNKEDI